jgi:uncharacterized protein YndB with AHSA1/START domain
MGIAISHLNVRRSILIQAPPERIWQEFETFERFSAWFGTGHTLHKFEAKLGAQVELSVEIGGEQAHYGGPVLVLDRAREITIENNWYDEARRWPVPTFFTIRLTPIYDGTLVEIFHHGFERLGADGADNLQGFEEGWDIHHLAALRAIVEP